MSSAESNYSFISLINSELFPKQEFKELPIIQVTEHFAQNYYINVLMNSPKPTATLVQLRRIFFGLGCSSYPKEKITRILSGLKDKSPQEIQILLADLRLEWKKLISKASSTYSSKSFTIAAWGDLLKSYYGETFKNTIEALSISTEEVRSNVEQDEFDSPQKIKARLEEYYVGPDEVKTTLARFFYEHFLTLRLTGEQILPKRNLLLVGPSGSGKSYVVQKLSEIINIPFLIYDSSRLTQRGIVGDKIEDILRLLYNKAKSLDRMKSGVIFFDEIDKLAAGDFTSKNDVSTIGPQQDLLKFIEGDEYEFNASGERYDRKDLKFNSSNLLIIAGGAFEGIEQIIKTKNKHIGFGSKNNVSINDISIDDLINYGIIKQLAARFQIITVLPQKTVEHLMDILQNVKDSILKIYINYFRFHGCELSFTESGIRKIAEMALEQNIGARGLVRILEEILPMYELGNKKITNLVVDEKYIYEQEMKDVKS